MRSLGQVLILYDWCPHKRGNVDKKGLQREDSVRTQEVPKAIQEPRGGRDRTLSHSPQKQPVLLTSKTYVPTVQSLALISDIQPPYSETINFCMVLSCQFVVPSLGKP